MKIDSLIPIAQYAEAHGLTANAIRRRCIRGTLPGAVKLGRDWFIPADQPYTDNRMKSGQYIGARANNQPDFQMAASGRKSGRTDAEISAISG